MLLRDLKILITRKNLFAVLWQMLTRLTVVIILLYTQGLNHYVVHQKLVWCCMSIITREDSQDSLGLQGDQTSQPYKKSTLNTHWKDSNTLATWCKETLMLRKIGDKRRRGQQRMRWLNGITNSTDMNLSKFQEVVTDRKPWCAWTAKSWTQLSDWTTACQLYSIFKKNTSWGTSLVVKTPRSQHRAPGFDLWSGNWIPRATSKILHATAKRVYVWGVSWWLSGKESAC